MAGRFVATPARVEYTLVPLGPVDLGEPPAELVDAFAAVHGNTGAERAGGETGSPPQGDALACARAIVAAWDDGISGAGEPPDGTPTAYLMIVFPRPGAHPARADRPVVPWRQHTLERAISIMAAEPGANVTVADLARATNVSVRTLQAVFRRHTGMSPMRYLRHLRLTRAHQDLLAADPRICTVARIANRWGFPHLGRFAATYRARYGYNPSTALQAMSARRPRDPPRLAARAGPVSLPEHRPRRETDVPVRGSCSSGTGLLSCHQAAADDGHRLP